MSGPIISVNIRVRYPEHFHVGAHSIVDDFCYFATRVEVGIGSHVANGCSIGGGERHLFRLGDFSSLSAGVRVWCSSNDFVHDIVTIVPVGLDLEESTPIEGDVILGDCTGVGANSVIMPDNHIPEGTTIGALSFVPPRFAFEPWTVYAGAPVRRVRARDRDRVLRQAESLRRHLELSAC